MEEAPKGQNPVRRNALGRGLSSLMSVTNVAAKPAEKISPEKPAKQPRTYLPKDTTPSEATPTLTQASEPETHTGVLYLSLAKLTPNPDQPRRTFPELELRELADSIRETGLIQPIVTRKRGDQYEIVAGERRFRAAKIAGLTEVPVIVRELSDRETLALGIIENVQRQDLNPIEEALAYQRLINEFGQTQLDVAKTVGKDRVTISNAIRLLKLPETVLAFMKDGKLSAGHGRALLMITDALECTKLAEQAIREGLSVRALEQLTAAPKEESKTPDLKWTVQKFDPVLKRQEEELSERLRRTLSTKVQVHLASESKGEVKISFFSKEELESLLERIER